MSALVGAAVGLAGCAAAGGWLVPPLIARRRLEARLHELCRASRSLVLTYDDGPGLETTPRVLEVLASHDARATFFVLGRSAEAHPEVVDRVVEAGHELGSHSHSHLHAWKSLPGRVREDIEHGYRSIDRWTGARAPFRPPYGKLTLASWLHLRRRRAALGWWTIDSGDSWTPIPEPRSVVDRTLADGGGVVLLHDLDRTSARAVARQAFMLETTEALLGAAAREGLRVRTLGDLLSGGNGSGG